MTIWLDAWEQDGGHVAIYTGNDDAPMYNPTGYIGTRTKFSTKFSYIPFVPAARIVANVSVPASISSPARRQPQRTINFVPHGMGGVPFIYGIAKINGVIRPLCGSIPIVSTSGGLLIAWTLGVNATNVFIHEIRSYPTWSVGQNIPVEIYISDKRAA